MALSEILTETSLCNQALGKIGATRIENVESDTSIQAIQCRLHYELTRDSLLRSHWWRFASDRAKLESTDTPDFEWDYAFDLPDDFLRMKSIYEDSISTTNFRSYVIEGKLLLTNEDEMSIRYVKKVTDVTEFDPLFIEVLILQLALKFIGPLSGGNAKLQESIQKELARLWPIVKSLDSQESNTVGQCDLDIWNDARYR